VICIEHNLDVVKCADWVIDMGPEAGDEGGELVFSGTPEDLTRNTKSYTGKYLKSKFI
jgi:excinuclease ABC subunit A